MPSTFSELVEQYLAETILRPATVRNYKSVARQFDNEMNSPPLGKIDKVLLLEWRKKVLERASGTSWNTYFRHWRPIWRWALEQELVSHDPLKGVKWHHPAHKKLPKTVHQQLLNQAIGLLTNEDPLPPGWFWTSVLRLLYYTGIRLHQLVDLEWRDLDLDQQTLLLRCESSKTYREWIIPLHQQCAAILRDHHKRVCRELGFTPEPGEQVFNITLFNRRYVGRRMTEAQVTCFFQRLSSHLDKPISAHRLRHTVATHMANLPHAQLKSIKEMLGHTDIRTTMIYVHPDMAAQRALLDKLPSL